MIPQQTEQGIKNALPTQNFICYALSVDIADTEGYQNLIKSLNGPRNQILNK